MIPSKNNETPLVHYGHHRELDSMLKVGNVFFMSPNAGLMCAYMFLYKCLDLRHAQFAAFPWLSRHRQHSGCVKKSFPARPCSS